MTPDGPVPVGQRVRLDNITITTADGRTFDLGRPDSRMFRLRVWAYRLKRRSET